VEVTAAPQAQPTQAAQGTQITQRRLKRPTQVAKGEEAGLGYRKSAGRQDAARSRVTSVDNCKPILEAIAAGAKAMA
jgi:hypothetical protein